MLKPPQQLHFLRQLGILRLSHLNLSSSQFELLLIVVILLLVELSQFYLALLQLIMDTSVFSLPSMVLFIKPVLGPPDLRLFLL